tara:strand:+ start:153 stop:404 length:252 start_codon:yes stop_codon:yes gene_type:complete
MKEEKYNGWTNYATWRVSLEIIDGLEFDIDGEKVTADQCKDYAVEVVSDGADGFALEYALAFLDEVNWQEIAEHINEGLTENA